jgi:hypothetical protein
MSSYATACQQGLEPSHEPDATATLHPAHRNGRKKENVTALAPAAQNFDLMYEQVKALKEGKSVAKPIYNHVSGLLDPAESIDSPNVSAGAGSGPACVAAECSRRRACGYDMR